MIYRISQLARKISNDRRAVTALEYGIIAGVLGLVLITIFQRFGTTLSTLFSTIGKSI
jgi:Flp pilus assembly pilin Flp